jgi:hypothetical protein
MHFNSTYIGGHVGNTVSLDPWKDILGIALDAERLNENLEAFRPVLEEIRKLRAIDLTDVHPCVIFEPTIPYRRGRGR